MLRFAIAAAAALASVGCAQEAFDTSQSDAVLLRGNVRIARLQAIDHPGRPRADVEEDRARKPLDVMEFAGLEPDMVVLEMEAGDGYYTEIFSRMVGANGKVFMQNPAAFDSFLGERVAARLAGDRLANVEYMKTDFDALSAEPGSVDLVTWIQGPHELWFAPEGTDGLGDPEATFLGIAAVLKSGGVFIASDHSANTGAPPTTGGETHRIDPDIVRDLAIGAGLVFVADSDLLSNPDDDRTISVFDPSVRGKTDQFLMRFRKP